MSSTKQYRIRVRLPNGSSTVVTVEAISTGIAKQIVEAQYGPGTFLGIL